MKTLAIDSLDDLPDAAEAVIDALAGRTVVAFRGEMGAGKTTLIGAILDRLGSADTVTSPTFALVNQYDTADGRPSSTSTSTASTASRRPTTSATKSISIRATSVWWSGPKKSRSCSPTTR